ncbi:unnamed protein product [Linum trigynum]|uniref:Reverse transcriptase domain-containing protein n=1 Tax=Linum trigynum TaxID=586398 RepID=A0AAV2GD02_9ROSI
MFKFNRNDSVNSKGNPGLGVLFVIGNISDASSVKASGCRVLGREMVRFESSAFGCFLFAFLITMSRTSKERLSTSFGEFGSHSVELEPKHSGKLILRAGDEHATFSVSENGKHSHLHDDIDYCDVLADFETVLAIMSAGTDDALERCILLGEQASQEPQLAEQLAELESGTSLDGDQLFKPISSSPRITTSLEEPPELELKPLPPHLEYAFLREGNKLPVIISSTLTPEQKERLVALLKRHERALAWKITDIRGISPSFCSHRILMEDEMMIMRQP